MPLSTATPRWAVMEFRRLSPEAREKVLEGIDARPAQKSMMAHAIMEYCDRAAERALVTTTRARR